MQNQSNKKTILYLVTQSELGGAQRYIFDLAANLKNEFNIAVAFGEQGEKGELAKQLKQANIKYYIIPHLKRAISPINDFLALIEIIKLIKKLKPDIIHLNSSKISILGSIASLCVMRYALCVYTVHGWVFNEPMPSWRKLFYKYAEKLTARLKNKIICVSEFDRQTAIKEKICSPKKLVTIHNGIKPINFLSKEQARQKLTPQPPLTSPRGSASSPLLPALSDGVKIRRGVRGEVRRVGEGGEVIIGSIANLYPTKGLEYLIEATRLLVDQKLNIKTIIIGQGQERKNLEDLIGQLNLKSHVILAGRIGNAAELLPAFDIYACSSVKEGLSYTIIEAMRAGLPIVATKVGGNPELIIDNETGLLTDPAPFGQNKNTNATILNDNGNIKLPKRCGAESKNPQNLAKKIHELINNPELGQKLGEQAKIKAEQKFGLERMVEETRRVYLN